MGGGPPLRPWRRSPPPPLAGCGTPAAAASVISVSCSSMPVSSDIKYKLPLRVNVTRRSSCVNCGFDSASAVLVSCRRVAVVKSYRNRSPSEV